MAEKLSLEEFSRSFKEMLDAQVALVHETHKEMSKVINKNALDWHKEHCNNLDDPGCASEFFIIFTELIGRELREGGRRRNEHVHFHL